MSDWKKVQSGIPAAVRRVLGKRFDVGWTDRESKWRDSAHCRLRIISRTAAGRTESRRTDNDDGTFTERSYTPMTMVVQFTFVSQDQDLYESALPYADQVMVGLRLLDTFTVLSDAGLGIASIGPQLITDFMDEHGRWRSSVTFEVTFNHHSSIVTGFGRTTDFVRFVVVNDLEIPEIIISEIMLTEVGEPLLAEDGTPLFTEGVDA